MWMIGGLLIWMAAGMVIAVAADSYFKNSVSKNPGLVNLVLALCKTHPNGWNLVHGSPVCDAIHTSGVKLWDMRNFVSPKEWGCICEAVDKVLRKREMERLNRDMRTLESQYSSLANKLTGTPDTTRW